MIEFDDPLDMSIYARQEGERELPVIRKTDRWWCRRCRHTFRRTIVAGPTRWRIYSTAGRVSPETACPACRKRLAALDAVHPRQRVVGIRLPGIDR